MASLLYLVYHGVPGPCLPSHATLGTPTRTHVALAVADPALAMD